MSSEQRERQSALTNAFRLKRAAWIQSLKDSPCLDCGGRFRPEAMDFDHRASEEKAFAISKQPTLSEVRILAEIAKCDLVCSNCHRVRTADRRASSDGLCPADRSYAAAGYCPVF